MDIERLKEDIRNIEYELEYGEEQHLGRIAVDVNRLRSVIDFANATIARQSVKSDDVREAIDQKLTTNAMNYLNQNMKQPFVEKELEWDEAVRSAIDWLEAEKESAQNDWERAGAEWRTEPGAQEMHDERMAAFDLAIQALRQMKPDLYPKAGLDPDADDWGNGYSRGYADGLQALQMKPNE